MDEAAKPRSSLVWAMFGAIEAALVAILVLGFLYGVVSGHEDWVQRSLYGVIIAALGGGFGGFLYGRGGTKGVSQQQSPN